MFFIIAILYRFLIKFLRANTSFGNCFCVPYLGKESHHFANCFSALLKKQMQFKNISIYKTFKNSQLFPVEIQNFCGLLFKYRLQIFVFVRYEQDIHWYVVQTFDH